MAEDESSPLNASVPSSYGTTTNDTTTTTVDTDTERAVRAATENDEVRLSPNVWSIISVLLLGRASPGCASASVHMRGI